MANFLTYRSLPRDQKARIYASLSSHQRKELAEQEVFFSFAEAAGLDSASVKSEKPPRPDISCLVSRRPYRFELGEVTDEGLARRQSVSRRTGRITGGAFSQDEPLLKMFREKATKDYETDGLPLDLILYFDKQYPFLPGLTEFVNTHCVELQALLHESPFSRVWLYDTWHKRLLLHLAR